MRSNLQSHREPSKKRMSTMATQALHLTPIIEPLYPPSRYVSSGSVLPSQWTRSHSLSSTDIILHQCGQNSTSFTYSPSQFFIRNWQANPCSPLSVSTCNFLLCYSSLYLFNNVHPPPFMLCWIFAFMWSTAFCVLFLISSPALSVMYRLQWCCSICGFIDKSSKTNHSLLGMHYATYSNLYTDIHTCTSITCHKYYHRKRKVFKTMQMSHSNLPFKCVIFKLWIQMLWSGNWRGISLRPLDFSAADRLIKETIMFMKSEFMKLWRPMFNTDTSIWPEMSVRTFESCHALIIPHPSRLRLTISMSQFGRICMYVGISSLSLWYHI